MREIQPPEAVADGRSSQLPQRLTIACYGSAATICYERRIHALFQWLKLLRRLLRKGVFNPFLRSSVAP